MAADALADAQRKLEQAGLGEGGGIETMRQQGSRFSLETLPEVETFAPPPHAATTVGCSRFKHPTTILMLAASMMHGRQIGVAMCYSSCSTDSGNDLSKHQLKDS